MHCWMVLCNESICCWRTTVFADDSSTMSSWLKRIQSECIIVLFPYITNYILYWLFGHTVLKHSL